MAAEKEILPLYEIYPSDKHVIAWERDLTRIKSDLESRSVTAWGQGPIEGTGFYKLVECSPEHKGDKQLIIVATVGDVRKAKAM